MATFQGTSSNNTFDGTTGDDLFLMADGGSDTVRGDAGNDTFDFGAAFDGSDSIVGGPGTDLLLLKGNYEAHGQGMMNVTYRDDPSCRTPGLPHQRYGLQHREWRQSDH